MRAHATPSLRLQLTRWRTARGQRLTEARSALGVRALAAARRLPGSVGSAVRSSLPHWIVNTGVAALILSLPIAATASSPTSAPVAAPVAASVEVARAQTASRGGTISAGRAPVTIEAQGARAIREYTLGRADTLGTLSSFFGISPEAIAFANGISDPMNLEIGRTIRIPPAEGALYTVQEGDTYAAVAERFKVDERVIMQANRLYFEPEHFAPDKLIMVPGAALPGLIYATTDPQVERPTVISRVAPAPVRAPQPAIVSDGATLSWPLAVTRLTQRYRPGHTGIDLAAPFGTPIVAPADGVVTSAGWVPVGGIRVCVKHTNGLESCSHHMAAWFVSPGQSVTRGHQLGTVGLTGVTTGPHNHFEVKLNGVFLDPLTVLR